ncbi:MAG: GHMP kinase [Oscillospiraceae bacterium]|nr:GHMP kinase [Oscillospiraceae bacterium]
MIITRTPFRVSFCGGGSDLPSFYTKHGGCVLSAAINKYMYLLIHPYFDSSTTILKYSKTEIVSDYSQIEHRYFRAILEEFDIKGVELTSIADIPSGTGLGSSSSFLVGLLHSIYSYRGKFVSREKLARQACHYEINVIGMPIGKQDQYAAACGGLNFYRFNKDGSVFVEPVIISAEKRRQLEENLMLFYIGNIHDSAAILFEQQKNISEGERERSQLEMCSLALELKIRLEEGDLDAAGELMHKNWLMKRTLASGISSAIIDEKYELALSLGATGGKLLGAGGGGFMLFYVPKEKQQALREGLGLKQLPFSFDMQGSSVIYVGERPDTL